MSSHSLQPFYQHRRHRTGCRSCLCLPHRSSHTLRRKRKSSGIPGADDEESTHERTENSLLRFSGAYDHAPTIPRPSPGHVEFMVTDGEPYCPAVVLRARTSATWMLEARREDVVEVRILARGASCDVYRGICDGSRGGGRWCGCLLLTRRSPFVVAEVSDLALNTVVDAQHEDGFCAGENRDDSYHRWQGRPSSQVIWLRRQYKQAWLTFLRFVPFFFLPGASLSVSCSPEVLFPN